MPSSKVDMTIASLGTPRNTLGFSSLIAFGRGVAVEIGAARQADNDFLPFIAHRNVRSAGHHLFRRTGPVIDLHEFEFVGIRDVFRSPELAR